MSLIPQVFKVHFSLTKNKTKKKDDFISLCWLILQSFLTLLSEHKKKRDICTKPGLCPLKMAQKRNILLVIKFRACSSFFNKVNPTVACITLVKGIISDVFSMLFIVGGKSLPSSDNFSISLKIFAHFSNLYLWFLLCFPVHCISRTMIPTTCVYIQNDITEMKRLNTPYN